MKKVVMTDSWAPKRRCWRPRQRPSLEEIFKNISRDGGLLAGMPTSANQNLQVHRLANQLNMVVFYNRINILKKSEL